MRCLEIFVLAGPCCTRRRALPPQPLMDGETWFAADNHVVIVGGASAERMQRFGYFEALLTAQYPYSALTFRNLAWSGDEVILRPRPLNFGSLEVHLAHQQPDVVLMFFGANESFAGPEGLDAYRDAFARLGRRYPVAALQCRCSAASYAGFPGGAGRNTRSCCRILSSETVIWHCIPEPCRK